MAASSILDELPASLQGKVSLEDGRLLIASGKRGDSELLSFLSLAGRRGLVEYKFVDDSQLRESGRKGQAPTDDSSAKIYAVNLIQAAYDMKATDIHLTDNGNKTIIHVRRMSLVTEWDSLPGETGRRVIRCIYQILGSGGGNFSPLERQDSRIVSREFLPAKVFSVRIHTEPTEALDSLDGSGTYMPLRLLYDSIVITGGIKERLTALGYPAQDAAKLYALAKRTGMVLIAGPTNSGKSTVLKHVFEGQAQEFPEKNYLSIEDPAEYPMRHVKQLRWNLGKDVRTGKMEDALNGLLRSDPNNILFGEIRHAETAHIALAAALTGHGVWSTIHALNAFEIITRIKDLLVKDYPGDPLDILCNYKVLAGLVYQRLIPILCTHCKESVPDYLEVREAGREHILPEDVYNRLKGVISDIRQVYVRGKGCEACNNLGFSGMKLAVEVVVTDAQLLDFVRQGKMDEAEKYWRERLGGKSHVDHAIEYIAAGEADPAHTEYLLGVPLDLGRAIQDLAGNKAPNLFTEGV